MITDNYIFLKNKPWYKGLSLPSARGTGRTCKMIAAAMNAFFNLQPNEYMVLSAVNEKETDRIAFSLKRIIQEISYEAFESNWKRILIGEPEFLLKSSYFLGRRIKKENVFIDHSVFEDPSLYLYPQKVSIVYDFLERIKLCIIPEQKGN